MLRFNAFASQPKSKPSSPSVSPGDAVIIQQCGLDAYLFLRYLRTLLRIFIPLAFVILPILVPINLYGGRGLHHGVGGLDQASWTNIAPSHTNRYWAHLCLSILVVLWVCRIFWYELDSYTRLRQRRLLTQAPATTVLVTDIPPDLVSTEKLQRLYNIYPGGVRRLSLQRDYNDLYLKIEERNAWVLTLEAAETRLIQKALLSHKTSPKGHAVDPDQPLWRIHLTQNDRELCTLPPFGKSWLPSIPYMGRSVDVIDHSRERIAALNERIKQDQAKPQQFRAQNAALIQFNRPMGAHMACRSTHHPTPHLMTSMLIEGDVTQVVWKNIAIGWWDRYLRTLIIGALIIILCLLCVVPVAFTGLLSQLSYLASVWPRLQWLKKLPQWFQGILQGVLPPCLLAATTFLLPIILERLILEQGVNTVTNAQLLLQDYYFGFLFLQVFLVVSVSSSVAAVLNGMGQDFRSLAALIAQNLPKAGNYFFSYMLLQGLSVSAGALLQIGRILGIIVSPFLDNTAREKWKRQREPEMKWGTFFPFYTNLAIIGIIYSVVSPLILIFNIITFGLFLVVQHHNVAKVSRFDTDTGGLIYPKAIKQLFTGLYVMELYLIGLFFLVRNSQNRPACLAQGAIMIIVFVFTAIYQKLLTQAYDPLLHNLPVMLSKMADFEDSVGHGAESGYRKDTASQILRSLDRLGVSDTVLGRKVAVAWESTDTQEDEHQFVSGVDPWEIKDEATVAEQLVIWLPHDELGVSDDEIKRTGDLYDSIRVSNQNACLNKRAQVEVKGPPPKNAQG